jgi:hypothetical protein
MCYTITTSRKTQVVFSCTRGNQRRTDVPYYVKKWKGHSKLWKKMKAANMDSIKSKLLKAEVTVMITNCDNILNTGIWSTPWTWYR